MHIVFLSARLPLTKTFAKTSGQLATTPYPHVVKVTSHHEEVDDLSGFLTQLKAHAALGHCLFKGQLTRPIEQESRAGLTERVKHEWVVFDFDKVPGTDAAEVIKTYLPAECQNVSYIVQLSASMFLPDTKLWSGHVFMQLAEPVDEQTLKEWFEHLNFTVPALTEQLQLSDSERALHWPLDRTVAYNSKLIFIAPPKCFGFAPAIEEHIVLVKKRQAKLKLPKFTPVTTDQIKDRVNSLRQAIGLDPLVYAITPFKDGNVVMLDPEGEILIHDIKTSGEHYIRFNLNGGDSYAYFIDLRAPELIRNFKGEPYLKTEIAAPDLWKSLKRVAPRAISRTPLEEGTEVLAFYATNQSSKVVIGQYDHGEHQLTLHSSGETAAKAWLADFGVVGNGLLSHKDLVFDPGCDIQYATGALSINLFKPTKYMNQARSSDKSSSVADLPSTIRKTLVSMLGNPNDEILGHFINWLAYVFQFRKKTETAWVMSGNEGTGKGTFVKFILRPLFGNEQVVAVQYGLLNGEYNGWLEHALFVVFEEADMNAAENQAALAAKLRHIITDTPIEIRKMRTDPYSAPSYCNCLFFSNKRTPVSTSSSDRRFNIADWQEARIHYTPNEYRVLEQGLELEAFADVLARWPVNEAQVRKLIETETRKAVHEATTSINQLIADAIQLGDTQFFVDRMPSDAEAAGDYYNRFNPIGMYRDLLTRFTAEAKACKQSFVGDDELFILFRTLIPDTRYFQDSKTWRKRHYKSLGLNVEKQVRDPNDWKARRRGMLVEWSVPEGFDIKGDANVVDIKKPKEKKA